MSTKNILTGNMSDVSVKETFLQNVRSIPSVGGSTSKNEHLHSTHEEERTLSDENMSNLSNRENLRFSSKQQIAVPLAIVDSKMLPIAEPLALTVSSRTTFISRLIPIKSGLDGILSQLQDLLHRSFEEDSVSIGEVRRGHWTARIDLIMACISLSVGLGNIWRFPYLAYENKGCSFLVPYFILLLLVGIPLFFMEVAIGQYSGRGPIIMGKMIPLGVGIAYAMSYISLLTVVYYGAAMSHCAAYIFYSWHSELPWSHCKSQWNAGYACINRTHMNLTDSDGRDLVTPAEEFYHKYVLDLDSNILHNGIGPVNTSLLLFLAVSWIIVFGCILAGQRVMREVTYIVSSLPFLMLSILVYVSLVQDGATLGLAHLFKFDDMNIYNLQTWRRAAEQVFYSLDLSTGNLIMYGANCDFRSSCMKDTWVVIILGSIVAMATTVVAFCMIGALSYETNIDFYCTTSTGQGLTFVIFSETVNRMPWPSLFSTVIFFCLFVVGLQTQLCCLEPVFGTINDKLPCTRNHGKILAASICIIMFLLGIPCITAGGKYVITLLDDIGAAMGLVFIGLLEALCVLLGYGAHRFTEDVHFMLGSRPNIILRLLWVIGPLILGFIVLLCAVEWKNPSYNHINFPFWALRVSWLASCTVIVIIVLGAMLQTYRFYKLNVSPGQ